MIIYIKLIDKNKNFKIIYFKWYRWKRRMGKKEKKIRKREGIFNNLKGKKGKVKIKNKVYID